MKKQHLSLLALMMLLLNLCITPFVNAQEVIDEWISSTSSAEANDEWTEDDWDSEFNTSDFEEDDWWDESNLDSSDSSTDDSDWWDDSSWEDSEWDTTWFEDSDFGTTDSAPRIEWQILNNDNGTVDLKFEIPSQMLSDPTSKAKVQVQFCLLSGTDCRDINSLPQNVQDELNNVKLQKVDLWSLKGKLVVNMNWESTTLTNLTDISRDWVVWLYNTTIEFDNTYDQFWSVEFITVTLDWNLNSFLDETQNTWEGFARLNFVEDQWTSQVFPIYAQPTEINFDMSEFDTNYTTTSVDNPIPQVNPEETKAVDTWIETNIALILLAVALLSWVAYKRLVKEED